MKSVIYLILLTLTSLAYSVNIEELQNEFKQDVVELNIFKKRFHTYLNENCNDNLLCYQEKIKNLKTWETVKSDKQLEYLLQKKMNHLHFDSQYWKDLVMKLKSENILLDSSQFVSVVDLDKQLYLITFWDNETQDFYYIGKDFISSGNINREAEIKYGDNHYFKTPAGIFKSKNGWRSDGKKNDDNITLGYGYEGRYIFYFGKQDSIRFNTFDKNKEKIYDKEKWKLIKDTLDLAVHSHKSSKIMGKPNSHGCVRMSDELNRFLDSNSILHKNVFDGEKWTHKYAKEPNHSKYHKYAGEYLIIFDKVN